MTDELVPVEDAAAVLKRHEGNTLPGLMAGFHPIAGLFGAAFEEVGGFNRLKEWANEDYKTFIKIMVGFVPPARFAVPPDKPDEIEVNPLLKETGLG